MPALRLFTILAFVSYAFAPGTPISHEAIWLMKRVGAPVASPDGKAILFLRSVYPGAADDEANKKIAAEWRRNKPKRGEKRTGMSLICLHPFLMLTLDSPNS